MKINKYFNLILCCLIGIIFLMSLLPLKVMAEDIQGSSTTITLLKQNISHLAYVN
ncbi:MAG: hypothetical protein N2645_09510 [Clostridia bacterium]|nr:hypothetical protein [Clostridia bacterium]